MSRAPKHKIARLAAVRVVLLNFQTKVSVAGHRQERPVAHLHFASRRCSLAYSKTVGSGVIFSVASLSLMQRSPIPLTVASVSSHAHRPAPADLSTRVVASIPPPSCLRWSASARPSTSSGNSAACEDLHSSNISGGATSCRLCPRTPCHLYQLSCLAIAR